MTIKNMGDQLKTARADANLTQKNVADETGFTIHYIGLLERNKRTASIDAFKRLSQVFNRPLMIVIQNGECSLQLGGDGNAT